MLRRQVLAIAVWWHHGIDHAAHGLHIGYGFQSTGQQVIWAIYVAATASTSFTINGTGFPYRLEMHLMAGPAATLNTTYRILAYLIPKG